MSQLNPLEGIEEIPWSRLTHAYGTAEDIPKVLRALLSKDAKERKQAMWELYGNLWHQGTVYEATSGAVPFLIRLAINPSTPERAEILLYLSRLYLGSSYREVHGNVPELKPSEHQAALAKEMDDVRAVRAGIDAGAAELEVLLAADDRSIQVAAAYLLGLTRVEYVGTDEEQKSIPEEIHRAALGKETDQG